MSSLCRVQAELQQSLKLCSSCQPRLPLRRSLEGVTILTQEIRLMWEKTWKNNNKPPIWEWFIQPIYGEICCYCFTNISHLLISDYSNQWKGRAAGWSNLQI